MSPEPAVADRILGALLGMAIGDALGLPTAGSNHSGAITGYAPILDEDGEELVRAGQFTAHSELALCLLEALITSGGLVDPMMAGYRFVQVMHSQHGFLLDLTSRQALEASDASGEYQQGALSIKVVTPGPAARITPLALLHSLGNVNPQVLAREVQRATLLTHADPLAANGALAVAWAVIATQRREVALDELAAFVLQYIDEDAIAAALTGASALSSDMPNVIARALDIAGGFDGDLRTSLLAAVNSGPEGAAVGAIVGALLGGWTGARAIPPDLIEGLDGRTYLLMAAPALHQTARRRAGQFLPLREER